jgi:hypothetical protein
VQNAQKSPTSADSRCYQIEFKQVSNHKADKIRSKKDHIQRFWQKVRSYWVVAAILETSTPPIFLPKASLGMGFCGSNGGLTAGFSARNACPGAKGYFHSAI